MIVLCSLHTDKTTTVSDKNLLEVGQFSCHSGSLKVLHISLQKTPSYKCRWLSVGRLRLLYTCMLESDFRWWMIRK